ncbi:MAG: phenylacetate--CoA ligase [Nitrospiraceae bacterium]|nr:phenylacetate--CoA ligase [Nitrospiraceae bacterium]
MYWNKEAETIDAASLRELQTERLRKTVESLYENVPFYRKKLDSTGVKPSDIKSTADIRRLPFTTREDLRENFPDGLLAVKKEQVVRLHTSSGTTGKPKAIFFSQHDIDTASELVARCLYMTGLRKGDIFQNMMTYGLFTGALMLHYGAEKLGCLVIPAGPGNTARQISLMQDFGTTAIHITPSYALYLASVLQKQGIDPKKDLKVRKAYVGAEPYTEETRKKIETLLGLDAYNCYGLSEMNGPGVAFECEYKNGLHIWEDNFIIEILDPVTGEPVPDGSNGELVLTTLNREAMPILRYRTKDLTRVLTEQCPCGRTHRRIHSILGRADDMFIIKGVNIYPQEIERVLMSIKGVAENYQIHLESLDSITIKVEIDSNMFDGRIEHLVSLRNEITEKLKHEILVKPNVELLEPGTLPISEGKAVRVIDTRTM